MRRKVKSYSLIEILIASMIFMVVAIFGASSFAMISKSNNTTEDFQVAAQCSNQLESFMKNSFEGADKGDRIYGIRRVGSVHKMYQLSNINISSSAGYSGFLAINENKKRAIFAIADTSGNFGDYYYKDFTNTELTDQYLGNGKVIDLSSPYSIYNNNCRTFMSASENYFKIENPKNYLTDSRAYRLSLQDRLFPKALDDKENARKSGSYVGINIRALNAIKKI